MVLLPNVIVCDQIQEACQILSKNMLTNAGCYYIAHNEIEKSLCFYYTVILYPIHKS